MAAREKQQGRERKQLHEIHRRLIIAGQKKGIITFQAASERSARVPSFVNGHNCASFPLKCRVDSLTICLPDFEQRPIVEQSLPTKSWHKPAVFRSGSVETREWSSQEKKSIHASRGWFRSIDLWVMGPARFRCATLLPVQNAVVMQIRSLQRSGMGSLELFWQGSHLICLRMSQGMLGAENLRLPLSQSVIGESQGPLSH